MDAIWMLVAVVVAAAVWLVVARWVLPRLGIKTS
jgi:hypothetical protein